jgi:hypothetical protein
VDHVDVGGSRRSYSSASCPATSSPPRLGRDAVAVGPPSFNLMAWAAAAQARSTGAAPRHADKKARRLRLACMLLLPPASTACNAATC